MSAMLLGREEYLPPGVIRRSDANYEIRVKTNDPDDHRHMLGKSWPSMMMAANGGGGGMMMMMGSSSSSQSTAVMMMMTEPTSVLDRNIIRSPSPSSTSTTPSLSDGAVFCSSSSSISSSSSSDAANSVAVNGRRQSQRQCRQQTAPAEGCGSWRLLHNDDNVHHHHHVHDLPCTYGGGNSSSNSNSSSSSSSSSSQAMAPSFSHEFSPLLFPLLPSPEVAEGSLEACVMSSYTRKRDRGEDHHHGGGGGGDHYGDGRLLFNGSDHDDEDGHHQRSKKNDCSLSGLIPDQFPLLPVESNHQNLSGGGDGFAASGRLGEQLDLYEAVQALYMSSSSSAATGSSSTPPPPPPPPVITSFYAHNYNHNNHNAAAPPNPPAYTFHHHHHHNPYRLHPDLINNAPSGVAAAVLDSKPPAPAPNTSWGSSGNGVLRYPAQGRHSYNGGIIRQQDGHGGSAFNDVAVGHGMMMMMREEELLLAGNHLWAAAAEMAAEALPPPPPPPPPHGQQRSPHIPVYCDRVPLVGGPSLAARQAILARLNRQILPTICSPNSQQPWHRAIFRFKEALATTCNLHTSSSPSSSSSSSSSSAMVTDHPPPPPLLRLDDTVHKIGAFKRLCEVSPIPQFAHFVPNQAILDSTQGESSLRILDFELGFGGQWASFIQEFGRRGGKELKITSVTIPALRCCTNKSEKINPSPGCLLEFGLARENLLEFAREVGLTLEVEAMPLEKIMEAMRRKEGNGEEVVAVNFGFFGMSRVMAYLQSSSSFTTVSSDHGNCMREAPAVSSFLSWLRRLEPRVVAVVEMEDESPLSPVSSSSRRHRFFQHKLESFACVFESLQEAFMASSSFDLESMYEIERLIFGPKIEDTVYEAFFNHHHHHQQSSSHYSSGSSSHSISVLPWRVALLKAGFLPLPFSNAAESQASCLVKMNKHSGGFNFRKQQENVLLLGWFNRPLISASAWV